LFYGDASLLGKQAIASFSVLAFSLVVSLVIGKVLDLVVGLRVDADDEELGLDLSQHAEAAYTS
jgi:ammonium transporter, Amt family